MLPGASSLAHKGFRDLWVAQAVSLVGDSVYGLIFLFMAHKISGDDAVTGMAAVANALPFLLFGPMAGVVADRVDRRKVMLAADIGCAVFLLGFALWAYLQPKMPVPVVVGAGFVLSSITVFFLPARSAAVPTLVPKEELQGANSFLVNTQQFTMMLGIALSAGGLGALEALAPRAFFPLAAAINGLTFLVSAVFVVRLPSLVPERQDIGSHSYRQFLVDMKEGIRTSAADPLLRVALPLTAVCHCAIAGFMIAYIAANDRLFGGKFATLGLIEFSFMVVMLVFGVVAGRTKLRKPGRIMALAWLSVGVFCGLMAWATTYGPFLLLNALCGVFIPFSWLGLVVYTQTAFPDAARGRVNSLWSLVQQGAQPVGVAVAGPFIARFGLGPAFLAMGVVMTAGCLIALAVPSFRNVEMPSLDAEPERAADLA
ncbi:MAG: MFS transporter [Fimbriimonadaceae bacterium]|nr:MFS transporter [Fimbriimonadaceae bacterium]